MQHLEKIVSHGKREGRSRYTRKSHLHCVQNWIVTRGYLVVSILILSGVLLFGVLKRRLCGCRGAKDLAALKR